jgi:hypothetical protein
MRYAPVYPVLMYSDGCGAEAYSASKQLLKVNGRPPFTPTTPNAPVGRVGLEHCGYDTS